MVERALKRARRVALTAAGIALLGAGVAMILLPGPALLVIPLGLGILATEYGWAREVLARLRRTAFAVRERVPRRFRQLLPVEAEEGRGGATLPPAGKGDQSS